MKFVIPLSVETSFKLIKRLKKKTILFFLNCYTKKHTSVNLVQKEILYIVDQGHTFSLCLLSLSQKLKAPSDPAVANV